ncbi:hypothetical protein [Frankia sp. BMG5.23]|uniref:hypothetical protein n=1 Tax=Frankia sp. BMG5.23 TaxID=683305 RepID=UPI001F48A2AB|nr:hypothetical protein [Frankia sp. BMG5.23]
MTTRTRRTPTHMHLLAFPDMDDPFGSPAPTVVAVPPPVAEIIRALTATDLTAVPLRSLRQVTELRLGLPQPRDDRVAALTAALAGDPADPRTRAEFGATVGASERTVNVP